ncbi:MAG: type II CAAX endopeptidase family protein [Bacteroidales bacterium]
MEAEEFNGTPAQDDSAFITAPFKGRNSFWRYFTGAITPFIVSNLIGAIPLAIVMIYYSRGSTVPERGGMPDFKAMGIDLNLGFALTVFPYILAFFTLVFLVRPLNNRNFRTIINGGRKIRWGRIFVSAFVWTVLLALGLWYSVRSNPGNYSLNNSSGSLIIIALLAILMIPFQAGFEELLFRGYLMQGFAVASRNRWIPIVATSVIFGLMHVINPEVKEYGFVAMIPQYIFFGLVFAILTMMDDGIELAIGAHTANNAFMSVFVTNKDSALQTPALYEQLEIHPWTDFRDLVIASLVFLAIIAIIYRWRDVRKLYAGIHIRQEKAPEAYQIP